MCQLRECECVFESFTSECAFEWLLISIFRIAITLFTTPRILCENARAASMHNCMFCYTTLVAIAKLERKFNELKTEDSWEIGWCGRRSCRFRSIHFKHTIVSSFRMLNNLVIWRRKKWLILTRSAPWSSQLPLWAIVMRPMRVDAHKHITFQAKYVCIILLVLRDNTTARCALQVDSVADSPNIVSYYTLHYNPASYTTPEVI